MRPGIRLKGSAEQERVRAMKARDAMLRQSEKSTLHGANIPTEAKPVPTFSQSAECAHEDTHTHGERVRLTPQAGPAREAKHAREEMTPFETGPAREAIPMHEAMHAPETGYADEEWTGSGTTRTREGGPCCASGRTRGVDAEFEWLEDIAEHLKTMGKDKMLIDLLARDNEKKSDELHDLHACKLPPRATGKEHDPTLHDLLHKMETLTLELNQLKDGSKLTDLDTTITGLSYLGHKRSPFVRKQTSGKSTPLFKKSVPIKTLHEAHLHGLLILACLVVPTELETEDTEEEAKRRKERTGVSTAKMETPMPVFTGRNIVFWAKDFARFLRLTGQTKASDMIKSDLVVTGCKTDWLRELLEDLLSESNTFVEILAKIAETFPVFETDMHIRQQLLDLSKFKEFPKVDEINQMEARIRRLVAKLTCGYSEHDKLILLRSKIPAKTWSECKDTPARKGLTHSYFDLLRLLKALTQLRAVQR